MILEILPRNFKTRTRKTSPKKLWNLGKHWSQSNNYLLQINHKKAIKCLHQNCKLYRSEHSLKSTNIKQIKPQRYFSIGMSFNEQEKQGCEWEFAIERKFLNRKSVNFSR